MPWHYDSLTGIFRYPDGHVLANNAYSGHGRGVNNPALQSLKAPEYKGKQSSDKYDAGPIPNGLYLIRPMEAIHGRLRNAMPLSPDKLNNMYSRDAFLIHGDNGRGNRTSSDGCIIMELRHRNIINTSSEKHLLVGPWSAIVEIAGQEAVARYESAANDMAAHHGGRLVRPNPADTLLL